VDVSQSGAGSGAETVTGGGFGFLKIMFTNGDGSEMKIENLATPMAISLKRTITKAMDAAAKGTS
jgi:hypothetical protein